MKIELSSHQHRRRDIRCRPAIMQNDRFPVGTSYNGLYREAPPEKGTVFRLQVYEREGKSVILVCKKRAQKR